MKKNQLAGAALAVLLSTAVLTGCSGERPTKTTTVHRVLPNGITVIVSENRASDVAAVQLWVRDGALFETADEAGAARLLQAMMFDETEAHGPGELQRALEALGAYMSGRCAHDFVLYTVIGPSASFGRMVDVLAEGVTSPVFSEEGVEAARADILREISRASRRPVDRAYRLCLAEMMDGHPYGRMAEGTPETLAKLTADDVRRRFIERYVGANMLVSVTGNLDPASAADRIEAALSGVPGGERAEPAVPPVTWPAESKRVVDRADVLRTAEVIGFPGPSVLDRDNVSMDVLLVILMTGRSSRLNARLKEELGLVHAVGAGWYTQYHPSPLFVWMELDEENAQAAEQAVVDIFREMAEAPVSEEELAKARVLLESGDLRMVETAEGQAFHNGYWNMIGGEEFANEYLDRVDEVTAEDVREAAALYFGSGVHVTALVGPE